jgi:glycerol-3-phosphate acyltransferase PlsY
MKKDVEKIPLRYRLKLFWETVRGYVGLAALAAAAAIFPSVIVSEKIDPLLYWVLICSVYIILGGLAILCIRDIKHSRNISNLILYDFKPQKKKMPSNRDS